MTVLQLPSEHGSGYITGTVTSQIFQSVFRISIQSDGLLSPLPASRSLTDSATPWFSLPLRTASSTQIFHFALGCLGQSLLNTSLESHANSSQIFHMPSSSRWCNILWFDSGFWNLGFSSPNASGNQHLATFLIRKQTCGKEHLDYSSLPAYPAPI